MQLTEHFAFEELIASEIAARKWIDNTPPISLDYNLRHLAEQLELVRDILKSPMHITSGYRCPELNRAVGGRPNSAHMNGLAADFICPGFGPPRIICKAIETSDIDFDQTILEYSSWCHFAVAAQGSRSRRQLLTITQSGTTLGIG
jgi:zinc D-Ala-D-Ala carboxypeptidase